MLKNYLTIALRNVRRQAGYASINIVGLAVGLAACLLIALYVQHQLSYDTFHERADRLYRVVLDQTDRGRHEKLSSTQAPLAPTVQAELEGVEVSTRYYSPTGVLQHDDRQFKEEEVAYADSSFFTVFSFPLKQGDPATALAGPNRIVLTPETAARYFGDADPIGQSITLNSKHTLTVTGIAEAAPSNSHLQFDAVVSFSTLEQAEDAGDNFENWGHFQFASYLLLKEGRAPQAVASSITDLVERRMDAQDGIIYTYKLEPITDIHLRSAYGGEGGNDQMNNIYVFVCIALFTLLVACINFVNLATARATERAKEVGVRKSLGASRNRLAGQFLSEAVLYTAAATVLALVLVSLVRPAFEQVAGEVLTVQLGWVDFLLLVAGTLTVGLLTGAYPALVLARFQPALILRGTQGTTTGGGGRLRKGLVVAQFSVSIVLIAATAVVFAQLDHMRSQALGFDAGDGPQEHVLAVFFGQDGEVRQSLGSIREQLMAHPDVVGVTASMGTPGDGLVISTNSGQLEQPNGETERIGTQMYMVDTNFVQVYGMKMAAGRAFSARRASDESSAFILNETLARENGFTNPADAVGRAASFWGEDGTVIGVVEDFHTAGLQNKVPSLVLIVKPDWFSTLSVRVRTSDVQKTVADLRDLWATVAPQRPFDFTFLDEQFAAQYRTEEQFGTVFGLFAGLAIVIACLGLLGLSAYTVQRRAKEIGLRKVLGASTSSIVRLLSLEFAKYVLLAFVIAAPLAYYGLNRWLTDFAYRIELGPSLFLVAGGVALFAALITVSVQSFRAARTDPAQVLKAE